MPIRRIPDNSVSYYLIVFDADGREQLEPDGTLMSETVRKAVTSGANGVTDVFFTSHGWKGDVPAAIQQYDAWITAMESSLSDRQAAAQRPSGFVPLIVGLHWPSLPWGDEEISSSSCGGVLSADEATAPSLDSEVDAYAARIAGSSRARAAIRTVLEAANRSTDGALPPAVAQAYQALFAESGLGKGDESSRPGWDQEGFEPAAIIADACASGVLESAPGAGPGVLGIGASVRDAMLMPLRQLSFWKMKDRARRFGETGGHELLVALQQAAPDARFHLMGHSFGCIVVAATVAGGQSSKPLLRPVDSLFLVQGALSLWSFAKSIAYASGAPGYFRRIVQDNLVRGPIVTTRSVHDTAVGRIYPIGAGLKRQFLLDEPLQYPKYGGIGAFGIQGSGPMAEEMVMKSGGSVYDFRDGVIYNLDASAVIKTGGGLSGAHSDIAHVEVAHAFWAAALGAPPVATDPSLSKETPHLVLPAPQPPPFVSSVPDAPAYSPPFNVGASEGGLLSADAPVESYTEEAAVSALPSGQQQNQQNQQQESPVQQRWFNAAIEDQPRDEPLSAKKWYTFAFDVDVARRADSIVAEPVPEDLIFPEGSDEVELTVQLDSTDFDISANGARSSTGTRPLWVPRAGRSHGKARFDISPKHDGPSTIKATIHKGGNFIHQMEITFTVGGLEPVPIEVTNRGRPASASQVVRPRDIGISIAPAAGGGYDCVVWGSVSARAKLTIEPAQLAAAIDAARDDLLKLVTYQNAAGNPVFQTSIDLSQADCDVALQKMARAGALLFRSIFFGPAAAADSQTVGNFLMRMANDQTRRLKLQIVAERTPVPWGLLYVGDTKPGSQLSWSNFLGMRHVIEQIPLQNTLTISDSTIPSRNPKLAVSLNMNGKIDVQMGRPFVADQNTFWRTAESSRRYVRMKPRTTTGELIEALSASNTDDQILYFFCHAASVGLTAPGGPNASSLVLTDGRITLGDLNYSAPPTTQLGGNPLVFINACESADLSPTFYDGFVPYFMAKGARGVVGTECKTPALFAFAWAKRFFERFLDGEQLGEVFLNLRREFLTVHRNPLGLLYAVYCDADTQIAPSLAATSADSALVSSRAARNESSATPPAGQ